MLKDQEDDAEALSEIVLITLCHARSKLLRRFEFQLNLILSAILVIIKHLKASTPIARRFPRTHS